MAITKILAHKPHHVDKLKLISGQKLMNGALQLPTSTPPLFLLPRYYHPSRRRTRAQGDDYYQLLLETPLAPRTPISQAKPATTAPSTAEDPSSPAARARVVFGSRLAGPAQRKAAKLQESQTIAGVVVPPRPAEPDNCCMSGCVNCVWDLYRDDLEEWAAKSAEARNKVAVQESGQGSSSMDDDGGGSVSNWSDDGMGSGTEELFGNIPVGIREFMKTEKRLKEKHAQRM